ncbi:potassium transporter family protein [Dorcoceras hygrometricum]|uniref:Potassium transporter family protein n=1 Tax=Dorcoceras hygrometricum TaxID=472368 RepID=A0A2Z6ZYL3_9LAMI|nr:potassium transporter family protein [Dorcoceras hygrometricum]
MTHQLNQTTSLWLRKHYYQQLISQKKSSKRSVSLIQTTPLLNALEFARLMVSSNHRNANYYQQQGKRHAYVIISIDSSRD